MNEQIQRQLQERIEAFAGEITALLQSAVVDSVNGALGGSKAVAKRGPKARKKASPSRHISGKAVSVDALFAAVKKSPGLRMEELAKALRTSTGALKAPMKELLEQKSVKTKGQARGTKYQAS